MNMMSIIRMRDCEVKPLQLCRMVKCDIVVCRKEGWGYEGGVLVWLWMRRNMMSVVRINDCKLKPLQLAETISSSERQFQNKKAMMNSLS